MKIDIKRLILKYAIKFMQMVIMQNFLSWPGLLCTVGINKLKSISQKFDQLRICSKIPKP
jgi:hypothetical protein